MTQIRDVLERTPQKGFRMWSRLVLLMLAAGLVWAFFAEFDEVAVATGEVVPQGQVKSIQHLEGGIIEKMFVVEGDRVEAGDPLVQLDITSTNTSREELSVRLDGFLLAAARLRAEAAGRALAFPDDVVERRPEFRRAESETFDARRSEFASTLRVLETQVRQRELEVNQLKAKQQSNENDLMFGREELAISAKLLEQKLTGRFEHLKLEREMETKEGEQAVLAQAIPRAESAVIEARERIQEERLKFRRRAQEELGEVEVKIAQTREVLQRATDLVRRNEIRSPIDGVVKSLKFHTIGGIVRPGETLMEIVPSQDRLVVEARLDPRDIGYVRVGQKVTAKISAYDFVRYGGLDGQVTRIAPDSFTDENGQSFFRVVVETEKTYLEGANENLNIGAGMQATVDIHTGRKTVLQYMLTPVLKLKSEAFQER
jgi:adhesin transport system membrane fusion protein